MPPWPGQVPGVAPNNTFDRLTFALNVGFCIHQTVYCSICRHQTQSIGEGDKVHPGPTRFLWQLPHYTTQSEHVEKENI